MFSSKTLGRATRTCFAFFVALALAASTAAAPNNAAVNGLQPLKTLKPDIFGGVTANANTSKWQVALVYQSLPHVEGLFCGATMIDSQWVLTAAHCFYNPETCIQVTDVLDFYVSHGSVSLGTRTSLESAQAIYFPGQWDCKSRRADIALIKLAQPITTEAIKLADSDAAANVMKVGTTLQISGWGWRETSRPSRDLIEASVPLADLKKCKQAYRNAEPGSQQLPEDIVCAGGGAQDVCYGDSGGPIFVRDGVSGAATQFGVVSFGRGCSTPGLPSGYTLVANYLPWITATRTPKPCTAADISAGRC